MSYTENEGAGDIYGRVPHVGVITGGKALACKWLPLAAGVTRACLESILMLEYLHPHRNSSDV